LTIVVIAVAPFAFAAAPETGNAFVLQREHRTIVFEPYGPNVIRVTLSTAESAALAPAGYGVIGTPSAAGWSHERDSAGYDVIRSARLVIRLAPENMPAPRPLPLDAVNQRLRARYFYGGDGHAPFNDAMSVTTVSGKPLLTMWRWSMVPNRPDAKPGSQDDAGYRVSATFDSPTGEHYYGLGQQQQGFLDLRDHQIRCWHDYSAIGGENVCVPFMVSSRNYGLIWDNPSKTTIDLGFNQQNVWTSEVGDRVSFFVIAGDKVDEIYQGYRQLTGIAHLLPKATYGYIQSKAIYPSRDELMAVAKGYRDRNLPLDVLVVDFLNMTKQGEMDLDPARWPDPAAMNRDPFS
jgi:alpha-D-xyloside xylohydrolase